jgi:hypothetical protein
MLRNVHDQNSTERRRGGGSCPECGTPIFQAFHTFPWGSQTRLLVCPNPECAKVSAEHERRRPAASPGIRYDGEIPKAGGRIEAELIPIDDRSLPLAVKLGKSGHVVYALPAMLKMGFRIVECTPADLAIMESRGITLTGSPPLVRWNAG